MLRFPEPFDYVTWSLLGQPPELIRVNIVSDLPDAVNYKRTGHTVNMKNRNDELKNGFVVFYHIEAFSSTLQYYLRQDFVHVIRQEDGVYINREQKDYERGELENAFWIELVAPK